jgi:iron complex outermembrane recepter protein
MPGGEPIGLFGVLRRWGTKIQEHQQDDNNRNLEGVTNMPGKIFRRILMTTALAPFTLGAIAGGQASAQDAAAATDDVIIVTAKTGSRIKRQGDSPSPLQTIGAEDLEKNAVKDVRDLIGILPINNGSENNSDNLTQNFTAGTANINLRGLGVASTLVLLNGKRQVLSSVATDDGSSFVDVAALVPALAIERVEILKDGASAIYGSDAVAGVANFITRQNFEGAEFTAEYRTRTNNGSQRDVTLDAVIGSTFGDNGQFLIAASYLDRTSLVLGEVDWLQPATSGFGNPGSFVVPAGNALLPPALAATGGTLADPDCVANGGLLQNLANGGTVCRFDFGPQVTAVPSEERLQGFARASWDFNDTTQLWAEVGYARNEISREVSPSFPVLNTPIVPADNPGNVFGEDVFFQGRPFGIGQPTEVNFYQHNTVRAAIGAEGQLSDNMFWDVSYVHAVNDSVQNPRDIIASNFQAALQGFGGIGCDTSPTAATPAVAGAGDCFYFNPFSTSFNAPAGSPLANDPSLREFIVGDYIGDGESKLDVIEANITGNLFELPAGPVGFALGAQYRDQSLSTAYDSITQQDGFAFLIGNRNFFGQTDTYAIYGELLLPVSDWIEVTGALRFEDYGGAIGDTLDPKVAVLVRPHDTLSLRGSYSTSFRAPSVFQTAGVQTNFTNILDFDGTRTFAGRRTVGDPTLQPETSRAFNFGATWKPINNVEFNVDYFNFSFENVLTKENAQAIVTADPFDPRIERTSAGTVSIVNVNFINADSIDTSGIDFSGTASFETGIGTITPFIDATLLLEYEVTNNGVTIDARGRLNRSNVGAPNQKFKGNIGVSWSNEFADANIIARHVSGYDDDGGVEIDSFTTLDANFSISLGEFLREESDTRLTVGLINALDEDPPFVAVSGSYDPRSADPRGRRVFVKVGTRF